MFQTRGVPALCALNNTVCAAGTLTDVTFTLMIGANELFARTATIAAIVADGCFADAAGKQLAFQTNGGFADWALHHAIVTGDVIIDAHQHLAGSTLLPAIRTHAANGAGRGGHERAVARRSHGLADCQQRGEIELV